MSATTQTIFAQIRQCAEPLMRAFVSDLAHDARWIDSHPGRPFIHVTRETGTELIPLPDANEFEDDAPQAFLFSEARPSEICRQYLSLLRGTLRTSAKGWLFCDGYRVHRRSADQCARKYEQALRVAQARKRRG
jgi:hypothetical protein